MEKLEFAGASPIALAGGAAGVVVGAAESNGAAGVPTVGISGKLVSAGFALA